MTTTSRPRPRRVSARLACAAVLCASLSAVSLPAAAQPTELAGPLRWAEPTIGFPAPPPASAQAYILVDAVTGQVLAERSANEQRPVASTIKLLTLVTALRTLDPQTQIVVGGAADVGEAGTSTDPGETRTVAELVDAILVRSGNDAAYALAQAAGEGDVDAFVEHMGEVAAELGLGGMVIEEPTGLDDTNLASAQDLATIARVAMADPLIRASAGQSQVTLPDVGQVPTRNLLLNRYDGATGLKTGFTTLAGYCLIAAAERDGRELIAVILGAREDPARFDEAAALLDHGFEILTATDLPALEARQPGQWSTLVPAATAWGPSASTAALAGTADTITLTVTSVVDRIADGEIGVPPPASTGVGGSLAAAMYRTMRHAHVSGAWDGSATGAEAAAARG